MMKRKLLLIIALLCLAVGGAWAQGVNYTTDDIGKLMGSDSKVYATAGDVPSGVTVSGMIAYVNTTDKRGLVIGPTDLNHNSTEGSGKSTISQAFVSCDNYNRGRPAVATTSWFLPSQGDFNNMIGEDGCLSADNLRQLKGRQANSCANGAGIWAELETENPQLISLRQQLHTSLQRYDTAYKQSTKSFLTETIGQKDTARDKVTKVIEWVARYWMELPDEEDAIRGRRIYQPFKDFEYRRDEAMMAQYMQQDFNKTEQQYQQGRKHGKKDDEGGDDVTPVEPEA